MSKQVKNPMQAILDRVEPLEKPPIVDKVVVQPQTEETLETKPVKKARTRENTVLIGGHFPRHVKQQLRMLAAEEDTTSQELLEQAINLLFIKKGKTFR